MLAYLAIDEWSHKALRITVAAAIIGAGLTVDACTTRFVHLRQVQGTVHAAGELRHIDVECQLTTSQLQHLILVSARLHQVYSWADHITSVV